MKTIAVIGTGALAKVFSEAIDKSLSDTYSLIGFLGRTRSSAEELAAKYHAQVFDSVQELIDNRPDYTVEFAGGAAVTMYAEKILSAGLDLIIASIGALSDAELMKRLKETAGANSSRLYLISGAIGGFDVMQTMAMMGKMSGYIDNIKAPQSLLGAPYLEEHPLDPEITQEVFHGSVNDAICGFPKNVNVAVAASLAAECPDLEVRIQSVPGKKNNQHVIHVKNELVKLEVSIESKPDQNNPKSSVMTAFSAAALLKNLASPIVYF